MASGSHATAEKAPSSNTERPLVYLESPDDPPAQEIPRLDALARSPGGVVRQGPYVAVQVNVDELGRNIVGDAANEPSIVVDPLNGDLMAIGWRQFDSVVSNFRQAGWGYTQDGGQTWTFPGVLEPGVFRSDPVLDTDLSGTFYYNSLLASFDMDVWRSTNGGSTWASPVSAFGGDKNWLAVDRSVTSTSGWIYGIWQRFFGCCGADTVTVSTDGGNSYQSPVETPNKPLFGTMTVGRDGTLFAAGVRGTDFQDFTTFVVDFVTPSVSPNWQGRVVELGGWMALGGPPNPEGLLGQANVAVDPSTGPTAGYVYLLASVDPPGADPMDVHLARSTDGGETWSPPVRVNDDAGNAWQWLAAHSVAPNGRIDVVWYDTRDSGLATRSQLYYSYSWDGGDSWAPNVAVTPTFDSTVGWPNQNKMGDYITLVSNESGSDVAFAATFNGEQDVYYMDLFPDCNDNGISDVDDIENGTSFDANANRIPDECELQLLPLSPGLPGVDNALVAEGATPGATVFFGFSFGLGGRSIPGCPVPLEIGPDLQVLGSATANGEGVASLVVPVPAGASGRTVHLQALEHSSCTASNVAITIFP